MSDNTQLNSNVTSGDIISTEVLSAYAAPQVAADNSKCQRVKLVVGAQHTDGGDVSVSNPLPVQATNYTNLATRAANDDTLLLLRRIVEICEPLATQDSSNRQRVTLDAITAALTLATVTTVTTVSTVTSTTNIVNMGGYPEQWRMMEHARINYATGIRQNLFFS